MNEDRTGKCLRQMEHIPGHMGGLHPKTDILDIISINPAVLTFSSDKVLTFPLRLSVVIEFSVCSVDVVSGVDSSLSVFTR